MECAFSDISNLSNSAERVEQVPVDNVLKTETRFMHIPYILNGELYHILTQEGENVTVRCCHCPPDRVYRGSIRSTGNFHMHIKRRHPDLLGRLHDMKVSALLERRDRFLKNRKNHDRQQRTPDSQVKLESNSIDMENEVVTPYAAAHYTHKLKIKTAFQRHQMQKQQQTEMEQQHLTTPEPQNWNSCGFVVPITNFTEDIAEPLNLCKNIRRHEKQQIQTKKQEQEATNLSYTGLNAGPPQDVPVHRSNTVLISKTIPSNTVTSPTLSNVSSVSAYNTLRTCQSNIKNELSSSPDTTIDLTTQTASHASSGIGLLCEDEQERLSAGANHSTCNQNGVGIILSVQNTLVQLLNEIRVRNQLDIAKFKYLHPNFQFHL